MSTKRAEHLLDCFLSACMDTKQVTGGEMFDAMLSRLSQAAQPLREHGVKAMQEARSALLIAAANFGAASPSERDRCISAANALHEMYTTQETQWDSSHIKQPGWHHVEGAFIEGAREAKANPDADDAMFRRAADGYTKRVFEEVDPESERRLRTGDFPAAVEIGKAAP